MADEPLPPTKRSKVANDALEKEDIPRVGEAKEEGNETNRMTAPQGDKDKHIQVLLSVEYQGTNYGGWQRQGPKNHIKFPSIQGTLENAATLACQQFANNLSHDSMLTPTTETGDKCAIMAGSSGRTDRGVHALDHKCLLRLPFSKESIPQLSSFLAKSKEPTACLEANSSEFLHAINAALPSDIHVLSCRIVTKEDRKRLRFGRKRYTYLIQQATGNLNRPWLPWNDYTYFVKQTLNVEKMQAALEQMQGTHDFLPLSCQKGKPNTVRTLHQGSITLVTHPFDSLPWFQEAHRTVEGASNTTHAKSSIFQPPNYGSGLNEPARNSKKKKKKKNDDNPQKLDPNDYKILQIDFEGSGFLRHQVRRMVSVLVKVGEGVWEPNIVHRILYQEKKFLQGKALAPGRALWKAKVWIMEEQSAAATGDNHTAPGDGAALEEEEDE